jgi:purine-binding chemotaxis protein CheW
MNELVRLLALPAAAECLSESLRQYGLVRIGGALLAIDSDNIREVVPAPLCLTSAGMSAEGLCGLFELRGSVIPVVDISGFLGVATGKPRGIVVLILRVRERLIGLFADEVCGLAVQDPASMSELAVPRTQAPRPLVTHAFLSRNTTVLLLLAERILALPGVPTVPETGPEMISKCISHTGPTLLFTCAQYSLGIAAEFVDATAPITLLQDSPMRTKTCLGIIEHHGRQVPVLDTLRVLGLGCLPHRSHSSVLVLRYPEGRLLGIVLDIVVDIRRLPEASIMPMPALAVEDTTMFKGVYATPDRKAFILLDGCALANNDTLSMYAKLSPKSPATVADGRHKGRSTQPYLILRAGGCVATPLADVLEIVEFPRDFVPIPAAGKKPMGIFTHRGDVVPLISLAGQFGCCEIFPTEDSRVLLVSNGSSKSGFLVEGLTRIEMAFGPTPKKPPEEPCRSDTRIMGKHMVELVDGTLCPQINLQEILAG